MIGSSLLSSHRLDTCCGVKQEQTSVNVLEMWIPSTAQEKLYYDKLFQIADGLHGVGRLAGQPAVAFLAKSDLDFPTLKKIWDIAGDSKLNYLRREDFYVAMRLIAMAQASTATPISAERLQAESEVPLPLPRMQNVPPPPAETVSKGMAHSASNLGGNKASGSTDPYAMSAQERSKYESLFPTYDSDRDGFVTGPEAVNLFSQSRLPREHLRQIWELSDADGDSKLSISEFCVGMHLIVCASKKGLAIPAAVPHSLANGSAGVTAQAANVQATGGSPVVSVPQSPVMRPVSGMQPMSTPPSAVSSFGRMTPNVGPASADAFSTLAMDLPAKDPTSLGSEADFTTATIAASGTGPSGFESSPSARPRDVLALSAMKDSSVATKDPRDLANLQSGDFQGQEAATSTHVLADLSGDPTVGNTNGQASVSHSPSMGGLVQQLRTETQALGLIVNAGEMEEADDTRLLREMAPELERLRAQLEDLRKQFQEQQQTRKKLRARVTQAASERATLLAEIKACDSSIQAHEGETAFLLREEAMIDGTRDALQSFRTALQKRDSASQLPSPQLSTSGHNDVPPPTTNAAVSLGEPPAVEESEPKVEGQAEPAMPGEVPPPPPGNNVLLPKEVQDPFAKVDGEEDVERGAGGVFPTGPPRPESPKLMMQQPSEEKANAFDAFPPVADAFASDPFAVNGFDETQLAEVAIEDPFSATDAVFTNATTAASDGFDAFPSSSGASFDAFGQ